MVMPSSCSHAVVVRTAMGHPQVDTAFRANADPPCQCQFPSIGAPLSGRSMRQEIYLRNSLTLTVTPTPIQIV